MLITFLLITYFVNYLLVFYQHSVSQDLDIVELFLYPFPDLLLCLSSLDALLLSFLEAVY